jgi:hypothetical protein
MYIVWEFMKTQVLANVKVADEVWIAGALPITNTQAPSISRLKK